MSWGMPMPDGFGPYWPSGSFNGWSQALIAYYMAQPPEVQQALYNGHPDLLECATTYPLFVSQKLTSEPGSRKSSRPEDTPFTPVLEHEPPKAFITNAKCNELASLISLNDRIIAVDEAMKALIEKFAPEAHSFFPIDIMMPRGAKFPRQFFILCIETYFDSFVASASDERAFSELPNSDGLLSINAMAMRTSECIKGLAFDRNACGGAHLWRERRFREWLTCFSDEFYAAIQADGLRLPGMFKMREA